MIAQATADFIDAQIVAYLIDAPVSRNLDATFVAAQTHVSQPLVEEALRRLQSAGWVRATTEGRWTLI